MKVMLIGLFVVSSTFAADLSTEQYMIAEDNMVLPNGHNLGQYSVSLMHWKPNVERLQIHEDVHIIARRMDNVELCTDSKQMLFVLNGRTVSINEVGVGEIGAGTISGSDWNWESLEFRAINDGKTVVGIDRFGEHESTFEKDVFNSSGNLLIKVTGKVRPITKKTYEMLLPRGLPSCQ